MTAKEVKMWDMLYEIQQKCRKYEDCKDCPFHITHKTHKFLSDCPIGEPYLDWRLPQREELDQDSQKED